MIKKFNIDSRLRLDADTIDRINNRFEVITINTSINSSVADTVRKQFGNAHSNEQDFIPVILDSPGGTVYDFFSIIEIFENSKIPVSTIVTGRAFSGACILAAFGTDGLRFAYDSAYFLIHEVGSLTAGKISEIKSEAAHVESLNKILFKRLAAKCKKNENFFIDIMKDSNNADKYISAKEAKEMGIIDKVGVPVFNIDIKINTEINME